MNAMAMQDFIVLTFENCSKIYDCFNPLFINQIQKRIVWDPPRNLKNKKGKKTCSFYVAKQSVTFIKKFFHHLFGIFKFNFFEIQSKFQILHNLGNLLI